MSHSKWWKAEWVGEVGMLLLIVSVVVGAFILMAVSINSDRSRKAEEDSWRRRAAIYAEEFQKRGLTAVPVPMETK